MYLATSNKLLLVLQDAKQKTKKQKQQQKRIFTTNSHSSGQPKTDKVKTLFVSILHHLFPVIFTNVIVVSFLLLRSFHCYTQREPAPTQKSARKWHLRPFANSCAKDYEMHSLLQSSFAELPNTEINLFYHYDLVPTSK